MEDIEIEETRIPRGFPVGHLQERQRIMTELARKYELALEPKYDKQNHDKFLAQIEILKWVLKIDLEL